MDKLLTKPEEPFLIPYRKGDKWGFCDQNKNIVIDCIYDGIKPFQEGLARFSIGGKCVYPPTIMSGGKYTDVYYGFLDSRGNIKIEPNLRPGGAKVIGDISPSERRSQSGFTGGLAVCRPGNSTESDRKAGCINRSGEFVIPNFYRSITVYKNGLAVCYTGKHDSSPLHPTILYNNLGDVLIENVYYIGSVHSDVIRIVCSEDNKKSVSYINLLGKKIINSNFLSGTDFFDGIAIVRTDLAQYIINEAGEIIKSIEKIDVISVLSSDLLWAKPYGNSEASIFNINEQLLITPKLKYYKNISKNGS